MIFYTIDSVHSKASLASDDDIMRLPWQASFVSSNCPNYSWRISRTAKKNHFSSDGAGEVGISTIDGPYFMDVFDFLRLGIASLSRLHLTEV